jgi:hypothetical protein
MNNIKFMTLVLAVGLFLPAIAAAQSSAQQDKNTQDQQNQSAQISEMGNTTMPQHTMTGMVSDNGQSLTSNDKTYLVGNPNSLRNYDNQSVSVVFQFDTEHNQIHIVSVTGSQSQ